MSPKWLAISYEDLEKVDSAENRVRANFKEFCRANAADLSTMIDAGVVDQLSFEVEDAPKPYEIVILWEWL